MHRWGTPCQQPPCPHHTPDHRTLTAHDHLSIDGLVRGWSDGAYYGGNKLHIQMLWSPRGRAAELAAGDLWDADDGMPGPGDLDVEYY